jgi:CRP/FNR family transcriptional regulator, cyclic AMP receptor protein
VAERLRLLSMVDIFETLPREELIALAGLCRLAAYETGENIFVPETDTGRVFVLEEGRVRLYRTGPRDQEVTLSVLGSGTVFGRLVSSGGAQGAYAQAMEPSFVSALEHESLQRLVMRRPEVGLRLASVADARLSLSEHQTTDLAHMEVPARLASLILRLLDHEGVVTPEGYRIPTRYTHQQLGTMIGANREAVTRAFALLRGTGAVEVRQRLVRVPDLEALKRAAATQWRMGSGAKSPR